MTFCEPHGVVKVSVKLPRVLFNDSTVKDVPEPVTDRLLAGVLARVTAPDGLIEKSIVPDPPFL